MLNTYCKGDLGHLEKNLRNVSLDAIIWQSPWVYENISDTLVLYFTKHSNIGNVQATHYSPPSCVLKLVHFVYIGNYKHNLKTGNQQFAVLCNLVNAI